MPRLLVLGEEELLENTSWLWQRLKKRRTRSPTIEKKVDGTLQQTVASKSELPNGKRKAIIVIVVLLTFFDCPWCLFNLGGLRFHNPK